MKAKFVKDVARDGIKRHRSLYLLEEPCEYKDTSDPSSPQFRDTYYLLASATVQPSYPEVLVLPCDERGTPLSTNPLSGSLSGTRNHADAIMKMGYELIQSTDPFSRDSHDIPISLIVPDFSAASVNTNAPQALRFKDARGRTYTTLGVVHPMGYVTILSAESKSTPRSTASMVSLLGTPKHIFAAPPVQLPIEVQQTTPDISCDDNAYE